jgi:signal transduction histidine kinase
MNCTLTQRRLLGSERPDQPPPDVQEHLLHCAACRAWLRRLVQLERQVPLIPVPPTSRKDRLIRQLLSPPVGPVLSFPPAGHLLHVPRARERALQKLSLALAMAAALLVFALGWWAWPHDLLHPDVAQHPKKTIDGDAERITRSLLGARTPRERVQRLADLADRVHEEAQAAAADQDRLNHAARLYARVVREHLLVHARAIPEADRGLLAGIAKRLEIAESNASRLAAQLPDTSPASASWRDIATVAAEGNRRLLALARGEAA